jgi:hypothetical protein
MAQICENIVFIIKGTVGSGKSKASGVLKTLLEEKGKVLIAETDHHCRKLQREFSVAGKKIPVARTLIGMAVNLVMNEIQSFLGLDVSVARYIIVDTCGEHHEAGKVFGVDLPENWKTVFIHPNTFLVGDDGQYNMTSMTQAKWDQYFAWSQCNLFKRNKKTGDFLNPDDTGIANCLKIHQDKSMAVYPEKFRIQNKNKNEILQLAESYSVHLKRRNLTEELSKLLSKI